eukprot:613518-Prorocentrum_minimum.AAC.3
MHSAAEKSGAAFFVVFDCKKFLEAKVAEVQASEPKLPEALLHRLLIFVAQHDSHFGSQSRTILRTVLAQQLGDEKTRIPQLFLPLQYDDVNSLRCTVLPPYVFLPAALGTSFGEFQPEAAQGRPSDDVMARLTSPASHGKVVEELGYTCTVSKAHLKEVLALLPPLDETSAAQLVSMMARTHSGLEDNSASYSTLIAALGGGQHSVPEVPATTWSYEVVVEAIREVVRPSASFVHLL